jgi:hypothetical protein
MKIWALAVLAFAALLSTGCGGSSRNHDVEVVIDPLVRSAEVDLVGINESQVHEWETYSLTAYFGGDDPLRTKSVRYPMVFMSGASTTQTFSSTDDIWAKWKAEGATRLAVMAQWPGGSDREILPLDADAWESRRIGIVVLKTGLQIEGRKPLKAADASTP